MNALGKIVGLVAVAGILGLGLGCGQIIGLHDLPPAAQTSDDAAAPSNDADASTDKSDGGGADASVTSDADSGTGGPCVDGGSCMPGECQSGEYACVGGERICQSTVRAPDGSPCGTAPGSVCSAGACVSCSAGADCSDPSVPCVKKTTDCSSGQAVCKVAMNAPDGSGCGTEQYCYGGVCGACQLGNSCSPATNPCHTGKVTSCSGGMMVCTDQNTSAAAGVSCQTSTVSSGVCDGQGACTVCMPNAACTPQGKPCQQGTMSCTSGPACGSPTNINEGKSCGSGSICSAGACVGCSGVSCASGCCDSTGCVTAAQTGNNCGTNGALCAACTSGQICTMGGGGCSCPPAASTSCAGACVNTQTDTKNGGACGHDCTALKNVTGPVSCIAGACSFPLSSCAAGWMHCTANPNDGCETSISQTSTCGSCTTVCPASAPKCSGSGNSYTCATGCLPPMSTLCGSSCVDTSSNPSYCGNCTTACMGGTTCQNSVCKCPAGKVDCNGVCQDPGPANGCGAGGLCGGPCAGPTTGPSTGSPSCSGSTCSISCSSPYQPCGNGCYNTSNDGHNCGGCGVTCTPSQTCLTGSCGCTSTLCPSGNTCVPQNACNGCGSLGGMTIGTPCGLCGSGSLQCSANKTSLACTVPASPTACFQDDEHCSGPACQCYSGSALTCANGKTVCGGWAFEASDATLEGWSLQMPDTGTGTGNPSMSLQDYVPSGSTSAVRALAIQFTPDFNTTCGATFTLIKTLCGANDTGAASDSSVDLTTSGKNLSVTLELVPFASSTEIFVLPGGEAASIPGPGTGTFLSGAIMGGTSTAQLEIEISIYQYNGASSTACSVPSATLYIQDIHLF